MSETPEWRRRDGESRLAHCTYLFHILEPCVCVHTREKCMRMTCSRDCTREMCVRQEVCRHPVVHTEVTTTWVRNTRKNPHFKSILISPTMSRSTWMLTTNCQISESILLGFPWQARFLILGDAFVLDLHLSVRGLQSAISNCMITEPAIQVFLDPDHRGIYFFLMRSVDSNPPFVFMLTAARVES